MTKCPINGCEGNVDDRTHNEQVTICSVCKSEFIWVYVPKKGFTLKPHTLKKNPIPVNPTN